MQTKAEKWMTFDFKQSPVATKSYSSGSTLRLCNIANQTILSVPTTVWPYLSCCSDRSSRVWHHPMAMQQNSRSRHAKHWNSPLVCQRDKSDSRQGLQACHTADSPENVQKLPMEYTEHKCTKAGRTVSKWTYLIGHLQRVSVWFHYVFHSHPRVSKVALLSLEVETLNMFLMLNCETLLCI